MKKKSRLNNLKSIHKGHKSCDMLMLEALCCCFLKKKLWYKLFLVKYSISFTLNYIHIIERFLFMPSCRYKLHKINVL